MKPESGGVHRAAMNRPAQRASRHRNHRPPQLELPGAEQVFNLAGVTAADLMRELLAREEAEKAARDRTAKTAEKEHPQLF